MKLSFVFGSCLLSYYDAAVDYLATIRVLPRLVEVAKGSTKEKVLFCQCFFESLNLAAAKISTVYTVQAVSEGHCTNIAQFTAKASVWGTND